MGKRSAAQMAVATTTTDTTTAGEAAAASGHVKTEALADHTNTSTPPKRPKLEPTMEATMSGGTPTESPAPVCEQEFALRRELVDGAILVDLQRRKWRVGKPIGKGSFGEIFLASDDCSAPVSPTNASYVVKIEPHSNGPLFVEIHCLLNAGKPLLAASSTASSTAASSSSAPSSSPRPLPPGMPQYIASGSHRFADTRYRFLILRRYQYDLAALVEHRLLDPKSLLCVAVQIVDVLEHLHDRGYAHSDIKAENLMFGQCTYERRQPKVDVARVKRVDKEVRACLKRAAQAARLASRAANGGDEEEEEAEDGEEAEAEEEEDEEDDDDEVQEEESAKADEEIIKSEKLNGHAVASDASTSSTSSASYQTPKAKRRQLFKSAKNAKASTAAAAAETAASAAVPFSGSNPMRSCRSQATSSSTTYQDMLSSHYLRPTRKIHYDLSGDDDDEFSERRRQKEQSRDKDFKPQTSQSPRATRKRTAASRRTASISAVATAPSATTSASPTASVTEDRIHLIDFGLAIKFVDTAGSHRPFCMDARRAHDGTLEFTSRDAHMGAHSRRSDLECLGYNLLYWTQGWLPWKEDARVMQQPEQVHRMKEFFMTDVGVMFAHVYGTEVPLWLGQFMRYVGSLAYHDRPDYELCRCMFYAELQRLGVDVRRPEEMRLNAGELRLRRKTAMAAAAASAVKREGSGAAAKLNATDGTDGAKSGGGAQAPGAENMPGVAAAAAQPQSAFRADVHRSMMKLGLLLAPVLPFREVIGGGQNRISPKNLRSKSEKLVKEGRQRRLGVGGAAAAKQAAAFSWTEILSTDPDQIARRRAEKEFERDAAETPLLQRYKGRPTYAILQLQNRLKFKDKLDQHETPSHPQHNHHHHHHNHHQSASHTTSSSTSSNNAAAPPPPPTTNGKKRKHSATSATPLAVAQLLLSTTTTASHQNPASAGPQSPERRKCGLRTAVRHTPKSLAYRSSMLDKQQRCQKRGKRSAAATSAAAAAASSIPHSSAEDEDGERSTASSASSASSSSSSVGSAAPRSSRTTTARSSRRTSKRTSTASSVTTTTTTTTQSGRGIVGGRSLRYSSSGGQSSPASDVGEDEDEEEVDETEDEVEEEESEAVMNGEEVAGDEQQAEEEDNEDGDEEEDEADDAEVENADEEGVEYTDDAEEEAEEVEEEEDGDEVDEEEEEEADEIDEPDDERAIAKQHHQYRRSRSTTSDETSTTEADESSRDDAIDFSPIKTRRRRNAAQRKLAVAAEPATAPPPPMAAMVVQRKAALKASAQIRSGASAEMAVPPQRKFARRGRPTKQQQLERQQLIMQDLAALADHRLFNSG